MKWPMALTLCLASTLGQGADDPPQSSIVCTSPSPDAAGARRRPGRERPDQNQPDGCTVDRMPRVSTEPMLPPEAVPDRRQVVRDLGYRIDWLNSYQGGNPIKGDVPAFGADRFFNFNATSGTLLEERRIGTAQVSASDPQGTRTATQAELFYNQSLSLDALLYRGDTVFEPPRWQARLTAVLSASGVHATGDSKGARTAAVQAAWFEKHLRDASVHDDFDATRIGIQPLTSDFRGFLLSDNPLAARVFGTRDNNRLQYNLVALRSLRKNAVSLNDLGQPLPHDDTLLGNLYWQDLPVLGMNSVFVLAYNRNREPAVQQLLADSGANPPATPARHDFDVAYLGAGVDGHAGWLNVTAMGYGMIGRERQGTFVDSAANVRAWFAASELSFDEDFRRWRLSLLHASGDDNPRDGVDTGFDGLNATPLFAGADSSFFVHQALPLAGGAFDLKGRNALLPSLRGGGSQDFSNPGLNLLGLGLDWDISPRWRVSFDLNQLLLDRTEVLAELMQRPVPHDFGTEFAVNAFYRPFLNQNLILRFSNAALAPGPGYRAVYDGGFAYSTFVFLTVSY